MFGSKTPNCLAKNEIPLSLGLPKIPKISKTTDIKRSASPFENNTINQPAVVNEPVVVEDRETEPTNRPVEEKEEPTDAIVVKVLLTEKKNLSFIQFFNYLNQNVQTEKRDATEMDGDNRQPDTKRVKTEFCSDNSVSLPGILPGSSGPVGFEPGMFKNDDESSSHSRSKSKDKEKSSDGTSKVSKNKIARFVINHFFTFSTNNKKNQKFQIKKMNMCRRRRRRTRRNINISTSTSTRQIVRTRRRRRKRRRIQIYLDF